MRAARGANAARRDEARRAMACLRRPQHQHHLPGAVNARYLVERWVTPLGTRPTPSRNCFSVALGIRTCVRTQNDASFACHGRHLSREISRDVGAQCCAASRRLLRLASQFAIWFQLALFWSTNLRSPAFLSELRLASHPSLPVKCEGCSQHASSRHQQAEVGSAPAPTRDHS